MKADYTHVGILLDRSGSMQSIRKDVIGGFNQFITEQKEETGKLTISASSFSSHGDYTVLYDTVPLDKITDLTEKDYVTTGSTALNDSFAKLIIETGANLANMTEDERPSKVLLISFTDGEENDSKEYTTAQLKELIKHQEEKYGWQFIYMGANQDSFEEGVQARGYTQAVNFTADEVGTLTAYASLSKKTKSLRKTGKLDQEDLAQDNSLNKKAK